MTINERKSQRTPLRVNFKIWHADFGEANVETRDISDSGVYLITESADIEIPAVGTHLQGQVQGLMDDAPVVSMQVVRVESVGMGLKFIEAQSSS